MAPRSSSAPNRADSMPGPRCAEAVVLSRRALSPRLVSITLGVPNTWTSTQIPDEYVRVLIAPDGQELALPHIDDDGDWHLPDGAAHPVARVYTVADHRVVDGSVHIDLDVVLHDTNSAHDPSWGIGSRWARDCEAGDRVGVLDPQGFHAADPAVAWQLLVCDVTGLPAVARIVRELEPEQRAEVHVVVTDPNDEIALPSVAEVDVNWHVVSAAECIGERLVEIVISHDFESAPESSYVWFAGEARAARSVRRHLRRTLQWRPSDFHACGYWQFDAERLARRHAEVADDIAERAQHAYAQYCGSGQDEPSEDAHASYLDALDDIYERAGL